MPWWLSAQLTYEYQINQPPPLGHPDCQFPELTLPGMCANMIVYIPSTPNAVRGPPLLCIPPAGQEDFGCTVFGLGESSCYDWHGGSLGVHNPQTKGGLVAVCMCEATHGLSVLRCSGC